MPTQSDHNAIRRRWGRRVITLETELRFPDLSEEARVAKQEEYVRLVALLAEGRP